VDCAAPGAAVVWRDQLRPLSRPHAGVDFTDHWLVCFFPGFYSKLPSRVEFLFLCFLLSMGLAVGVAFLSRKYFEEWFLKLKDRWTPPVSKQPPDPMAMVGDRTLEQPTT
jgi:hypothetical protein